MRENVMDRWVQELEHLEDNIQNGWLASAREFRYPPAPTNALCEAVGYARLSAAGATLRGDALVVPWEGISLTRSDDLSSQTWELFGTFGLRMTAAWVASQEHAHVVYPSDSPQDRAVLVTSARSSRTVGDLARVLRSFAFANTEESEIRVFARAGSRVAFRAVDIERAFVPSEGARASLRTSLPGTAITVRAQPELPLLPAAFFNQADGLAEEDSG